jgi:hypothetical protein
MRTLQVLYAVLLLAGCARARPTARAAAAPDAVPAPATPSSSVSAPTWEFQVGACSHHVGCMEVCVLRSGRLEPVAVFYNVTTGDTIYRGRPFSAAFPVDSTYAANASWYRKSEVITTPVGRFVKYGLPRLLGTTDVVPVATFNGVTIFAEPRANLRRPDVIYIPVRPGCLFQPYNHGEINSGVVDTRP